MAQHAAQQTLQRLAEQNLMSFDLIAAVNNKLNASVIGIETEINEIYGALITFFKQSKSDIIKLESRVERLERNVNLLNWQNAIEYQMFNGVEYPELDNVSKIVCLTRDFYDITKGEWTTSDLLLLKTAMSTIEISPRDSINFYDFIQRITYDSALSDYLLGGKQIQSLPEPYLIPLLGMKKLELLDGEESYVVDTIMEQMEGNHIPVDRRSIQSSLARRYLRQETQVDVDAQVNHYDLIMEMLFNLQAAESMGVIKSDVEEISAADLYEQGVQFEKGEEVQKDLVKAAKLYQAAHEYGYEKATCALGLCYELGMGVEMDKIKAVELYRMAAERGLARAQCNLGYCYYHGIGVAENDEEAAKWFKLAADQDYPRAMELLGECYENGYGVENDEARAVELYQKSHRAGYAPATCSLGLCYELGTGVEVDKVKAVELYHQAADNGNVTAMCNLGFCYYIGIGVEKDNKTAFNLFEKAASLGQARAQYLLGECYLKGFGVSRNRERARYWLEKSAEQGYESAKKMLEENFG